jgi:outer membrane lipoprotein-sorting protein
MRWVSLFSITLGFGSTVAGGARAADEALLQGWIQAQSEVTSLVGEFSQERKLLAVRKPLVAPGKFWYKAPDRFRWDLGQPVKSVAVHAGDRFTWIDVDKGKAEVHALDSAEADPRMASYLEMSFPRDWASFRRDFTVRSVTEQEGRIAAELEPNDARAARGVKTITFWIDRKTMATLGFALALKDGSEMTTTFTDVRRNVTVPESTFAVSLDGLRVKRDEG